MPTNQQLGNTQLNEKAMMVKAKVESVTEIEVIHNELHTLMGRDRVVENWLCEQVAQEFNLAKSS